MAESQNIEWKRSWHDKYLEWVCGFANAKGGTIFIGKGDDGLVHGLSDSKDLLETIPQKIRSHLGLTIDVNLHETDDGDFIEIPVREQSVAVSYRGHYYYRSGSTKSELTGASLNEFLLQKSGRSWDASIETRATLADIDPDTANSTPTPPSKFGSFFRRIRRGALVRILSTAAPAKNENQPIGILSIRQKVPCPTFVEQSDNLAIEQAHTSPTDASLSLGAECVEGIPFRWKFSAAQ